MQNLQIWRAYCPSNRLWPLLLMVSTIISYLQRYVHINSQNNIFISPSTLNPKLSSSSVCYTPWFVASQTETLSFLHRTEYACAPDSNGYKRFSESFANHLQMFMMTILRTALEFGTSMRHSVDFLKCYFHSLGGCFHLPRLFHPAKDLPFHRFLVQNLLTTGDMGRQFRF